MPTKTAPKRTSAARVAANRRNAQNSTGPRTAPGKARVAANAIKHGLLSQNPPAALPNSEIHNAAMPADHLLYQQTVAAFTADMPPHGPIELLLVERLASLHLRLARLTRIESGTFANGIDLSLALQPDLAGPDPVLIKKYPSDRVLAEAFQFNSTSLNLLTYYEARLTRDFHRTLSELRHTQQLRQLTGTEHGVVKAVPEAEAVHPAPAQMPAPAPVAENGQTNPIAAEPEHFAPLPSHPAALATPVFPHAPTNSAAHSTATGSISPIAAPPSPACGTVITHAVSQPSPSIAK